VREGGLGRCLQRLALPLSRSTVRSDPFDGQRWWKGLQGCGGSPRLATGDGGARKVTADDERVAPGDWFYPNHLVKFVVFGLLGGGPFFVYWAYRSWKAYAANAGYSRHVFWGRVREKTGYRPSPFWRTLFLQAYFLCLFPAVDRECRARGLRGVRGAELLAWGFGFLLLAGPEVAGVVEKGLISPVWAVLPVQLAVNRLHTTDGRPLRWTTDGWELLWVALGLLSTVKG
jgi:hypothetical protein